MRGPCEAGPGSLSLHDLRGRRIWASDRFDADPLGHASDAIGGLIATALHRKRGASVVLLKRVTSPPPGPRRLSARPAPQIFRSPPAAEPASCAVRIPAILDPRSRTALGTGAGGSEDSCVWHRGFRLLKCLPQGNQLRVLAAPSHFPRPNFTNRHHTTSDSPKLDQSMSP